LASTRCSANLRARPSQGIVSIAQSHVRRHPSDPQGNQQLGIYDPLKDGVNYEIDLALAEKWLAVGAKPSETVNSMIRKARTAAAKA